MSYGSQLSCWVQAGMMKRINPKTGKPFKSGDTREDGMVFRSYQLKSRLPSDTQYFYENWYSPEAFKAKTESANERTKKLTKATGIKGLRRKNPITGKLFKYGDLSEDGSKVFSAYNDHYRLNDGYSRELWYGLEAFEKVKEAQRIYYQKNFFIVALARAKRRTRGKDVLFNITAPYLESIFPKDNLCPVFGVELERGGEGDERDNSPSLDRIIPKLGYVEGNVVWISNRANILKRDATWEELQKVASWLKSIVPK